MDVGEGIPDNRENAGIEGRSGAGEAGRMGGEVSEGVGSEPGVVGAPSAGDLSRERVRLLQAAERALLRSHRYRAKARRWEEMGKGRKRQRRAWENRAGWLEYLAHELRMKAKGLAHDSSA